MKLEYTFVTRFVFFHGFDLFSNLAQLTFNFAKQGFYLLVRSGVKTVVSVHVMTFGSCLNCRAVRRCSATCISGVKRSYHQKCAN